MGIVKKSLMERYVSEKRVKVLEKKLDLITRAYKVNGEGYFIPKRDADIDELKEMGLVEESIYSNSYVAAPNGADLGIFLYRPSKRTA